MAQPEKNIIFAHGTTGLTDIKFRIHQTSNNFVMDDADGIFKASPGSPDIDATEDPENDGVYIHDEERVDWPEPSGKYIVYAYQDGQIIAESGVHLRYGKGTARLSKVTVAGGIPKPVAVVTETLEFPSTPDIDEATTAAYGTYRDCLGKSKIVVKNNYSVTGATAGWKIMLTSEDDIETPSTEITPANDGLADGSRFHGDTVYVDTLGAVKYRVRLNSDPTAGDASAWSVAI